MHTRELSVGQNTLRFETGKLAKQADGSVIVRFGDSVVLVTACRAANPREGIDFLPLTVDYREYTYASGRIPGGFFKREGKPAEKEVLTSRMIDRPIRPLFPAGWRYETQIIALVLSADHGERHRRAGDHRRVGGAGAVGHPVPEDDRRRPHRPGRRPVHRQPDLRAAQRAASSISIVAGSKDGLVMVEAGAKEVTEEQVVDGARHARTRPSSRSSPAIDDLAKEAGKKKLTVAEEGDRRRLLRARSRSKVSRRSPTAMRIRDKLENYGTVDQVLEGSGRRAIPTTEAEQKADAKAIFKELKEKVLRDEVLDARRPRSTAASSTRSGRIWIETGVLPRTHGSAVFTRGETQALVTCTLGTADDAQKIESFEGETWKSFMLHYNFPPFSVGEVGRS